MHPYYPTPWRGIEGNFESLPTDINTNRPKRSFNARILIADDEPRARASLKEILRFTGYETTLAECGSEAIDLLNTGTFDLILLDLNMPDLHGHKVMEHIDAYQLNCDIIVVSGETTFDHATMALRKGAQDFLRKPFAPDELLRSVANVLERRQLKASNQSIQLRLQESESLHKFIVNNSPDMIYLLDHEGRFAFINERVKSLLGYDQKEIIGEHFSKLIHTEDIER
ncbi:MAG: response regulator, partial [Candidatus Thiodiazotropha sp.]